MPVYMVQIPVGLDARKLLFASYLKKANKKMVLHDHVFFLPWSVRQTKKIVSSGS